MIYLKTEDEIELMRAANLLVADTLAELGKMIHPGVSTADLDRVAEEYIRDPMVGPSLGRYVHPSMMLLSTEYLVRISFRMAT